MPADASSIVTIRAGGKSATATSTSACWSSAKPCPLRRDLEKHLALPGMPRDKVMALVVTLLESTLIRIGNSRYARDNRSYGLTTLRTRHVNVSSTAVRFHFRGKSGVEHEVTLRDRRLARLMRRCMELPGQQLFQYLDEDGQRRAVSSNDVNLYLREMTGRDFTAKDYRTWAGSALALERLRKLDASSASVARRTWWKPSSRSRASWAIPRRSVASAISIRRFCKPSAMGSWSNYAQRASANG